MYWIFLVHKGFELKKMIIVTTYVGLVVAFAMLVDSFKGFPTNNVMTNNSTILWSSSVLPIHDKGMIMILVEEPDIKHFRLFGTANTVRLYKIPFRQDLHEKLSAIKFDFKNTYTIQNLKIEKTHTTFDIIKK